VSLKGRSQCDGGEKCEGVTEAPPTKKQVDKKSQPTSTEKTQTCLCKNGGRSGKEANTCAGRGGLEKIKTRLAEWGTCKKRLGADQVKNYKRIRVGKGTQEND